MKFIILIISLFFTFPQSFEHLITIETTCDYCITDQLGCIYIVKGKEVLKYNEEGNKLSSYSNSYLGKISSIDVSDPFRVLIFYKDYNQILFLDNELTEIGSPIEIDELEIYETELVCASNLGGFWVLNNQTNQIIRFDKSLQKLQDSGNINSYIDTDILPDFLVESNDFLFLNYPNYGIAVFDQFGGYYKLLKEKSQTPFNVSGNDIIYFDTNDNLLKKYNFRSFNTVTIPIPDTVQVKNALVNKSNCIIVKDSQIDIYISK